MNTRFSVLAPLGGAIVFLAVGVLHIHRTQPRVLTADKTSFGDTEDPNARLRHEWMMLRNPATGEIPRGIRQREMEFAKTLPQVEDVPGEGDKPGATWVSRGPWNVGGRTRALGVDASNTNVVLAGGVSGGMWRSADGGATWIKATALNALQSVSCLAQDTRTGQTATWYYGTGEYVGNSAGGAGEGSGYEYRGDGVFKSTNNGASWTLLPATSTGIPQTFDSFFDYVWNIVVDPTNGNVYAATYGAILRSTNGGTNWSVVLGGAQPYSSLTDIQVTANGTFYATGSGDGGMAGVWRSTTGASGTWTNISPGDMLTSVRRIVVGIAPSNNNIVYVLAETPSAGTNNHSVWRYDGSTWTNRSANLPAYAGDVGNFDSQGSYDLVIKVKPDNPSVVIYGGTNLYRTTDGFATAPPSNRDAIWIGGYATANDISQYANHHPDQHSLVFKPGDPNTLYSGHDGGVTRTSSISATPVVWEQLSRGYLTTQCYTITIDHSTTSSTILTGLQDNGCWGVTSAASNANWTSLSGGDGTFTAVANGGATYYTSSQNGRTYRYVVGSGLDAIVDPAGRAGSLFVNPFILDPTDSRIMYFAGQSHVWRNSNLTGIPSGNNTSTSINWTRLDGTGVTGQTAVSALAISKSAPANRLYFGHSGGLIGKVENANTGSPSAVDVTPPGGQPSYVSSIAVDPTDGNKVLVAYSNYEVVSLYYSANGGTNWTNVEGNLSGPAGPSCRSVAIVPSGGTTTYLVGTSVGLYSTASLNGSSTTWAQEGTNTVGNAVVTFLDSRTTDGLVVAGTHANGVYSATLGGGGGGTTTTVYSGDANQDGTCDARDILPIGRFFGLTGPARTGGSTTWAAQTATIWSSPDATHADCDGNGSVQAADVSAIVNNYGRTRSGINDRPETDKVKICNELLREIDRQGSPSPAIQEIRSEVVRYMQQQLGVTFKYALEQNYPNPFNPSTTIRFTVPSRTPQATLRIFDITGRAVWSKTLTNVETGSHEVVWKGTSSNGGTVASGMYISQFTAGNFTASKRMLMTK